MARGFGRLIAALVCVASLACGVPRASGPNDAVKVSIPHERYVLPNGLEVVLAPDHKVPLVSIRVRYHSGSKDDPAGRAGMAHLVEHLTFAAGVHLGKDAVIPLWEKLGAHGANGETNLDHTDYYVTLPSAQLEAALWIEAERMAYVAPALDDDTLVREKGVVHAEWRQHHGNEPYGLVENAVYAALFPPSHPYHSPPGGDPAEFGATTKQDVVAFLARHYVPENATLFVVGDFDAANARKLVERHLGVVAPGRERLEPRKVPTPTRPVRSKVRMEANVPLPLMVVAWLGPPTAEPGWYELQHGLRYVTGMLNRRLVEERKVARDVTPYRGRGRLGSVFEVRITAERGATFDDLVGEVKYAVERNRWGWVHHESSEIAKTIFDLEDLTDRTERMANGIDWFETPDFATPTIEAANVSVVGVSAAVEELLEPDRAAYVWVQPNAGAPPEGRVIE